MECTGSEKYDFIEAKKKSKNRKYNPKYLKMELRHLCDQCGVSHVRSSGAGQEPLKFPHLFPHKTIKALLWEPMECF